MTGVFPLFMFLIFPFVALLLGFAAGNLMKFTGGWRLVLLIFTPFALFPWGFHVSWTRSSLKNDAQPTLVEYATQLAEALATFMTFNISLGVLILIAIPLAIWREPLLNAVLPLILGFLYWHFPLSRLTNDVAAIDYDLLPIVMADVGILNAWLFWLSFAASTGLFGYALTRYLEPSDLKAYFPLR